MFSTLFGGAGTVLRTLSPQVFLLSDTQLLALIVGVICGQTLVQSRKFNQLKHITRNMNDPPAKRVDGGQYVDTGKDTDKRGPLGNGTSGGGLVCGAISGAALGSSWGPGGTAGGAVFGAVLGDVIESLTIDY